MPLCSWCPPEPGSDTCVPPGGGEDFLRHPPGPYFIQLCLSLQKIEIKLHFKKQRERVFLEERTTDTYFRTVGGRRGKPAGLKRPLLATRQLSPSLSAQMCEKDLFASDALHDLSSF